MKSTCHNPARQEDELSQELLTLLASGNSGLGIRELAKRLRMSRKETLLLLVTLESQGVLIWEFDARKYRPDPDSLFIVLHGDKRPLPKGRRSGMKPLLLAKAA